MFSFCIFLGRDFRSSFFSLAASKGICNEKQLIQTIESNIYNFLCFVSFRLCVFVVSLFSSFQLILYITVWRQQHIQHADNLIHSCNRTWTRWTIYQSIKSSVAKSMIAYTIIFRPFGFHVCAFCAVIVCI